MNIGRSKNLQNRLPVLLPIASGNKLRFYYLRKNFSENKHFQASKHHWAL